MITSKWSLARSLIAYFLPWLSQSVAAWQLPSTLRCRTSGRVWVAPHDTPLASDFAGDREPCLQTPKEIMERIVSEYDWTNKGIFAVVCLTYLCRLMASGELQESFVNLATQEATKTIQVKRITARITSLDHSRTQIPLQSCIGINLFSQH